MNTVGMELTDALALAGKIADYENPRFVVDSDNPLSVKLYELLLWRLKGSERLKKKEVFSSYLGYDGYCKTGNISRLSWENQNCNGSGWWWWRLTGPADGSELNRAEMFLYDCTYFSISYAIYALCIMNELTVSDLLAMDCDAIFDLMDSHHYIDDISNWIACLFEDASEGTDIDTFVRFLAHGAYFIDCAVSGRVMEQKYLDRLDGLGSDFLGLCCDGAGYYGSFIDTLKKQEGISEDATGVMLPYLLDVFFSFKDADPGNGGGTPCLYTFSSRSIKEYRDIRDRCADSPYVAVMDSLLLLLQDPARVCRSYEAAGVDMVDDCVSMCELTSLSTCFTYTEHEYVGCYYFFHMNETITLHPYFMMARECFDVILCELKQQLALQCQRLKGA